MSECTPRIALIHATRLAIDPIEEAAKRHWPDAELVTLLDESLERDRRPDEDLAPDLHNRTFALANHACGFGADGMLFTCSAFGSAIEAADRALPIPVMRPNAAMFEAGLECGNALAMIYTFRPAAGSMAAEFDALVAERNVPATLTGIYCDNALTAKRSGDPDLHDRLIADCAGEQTEFDAILLAQFSMAGAAPSSGDSPAFRSSRRLNRPSFNCDGKYNLPLQLTNRFNVIPPADQPHAVKGAAPGLNFP